MLHTLPPFLLLSNSVFKASNAVFKTYNTVKTDNCTTSRFKVFARGSVVSVVSMDARDATIGVSVRIKRLKRDVLRSNPWRACLNETNLLLQLLLQCRVHV